jgi:hypothetical protein
VRRIESGARRKLIGRVHSQGAHPLSFECPLLTQSGHSLVNEGWPRLGLVHAPTPLPFSALSISLSITGSSIVAGMVQGSPSAIFFMVPRRTLPERVFGSRATVITSLKAATGPILASRSSRSRAVLRASASLRSEPPTSEVLSDNLAYNPGANRLR